MNGIGQTQEESVDRFLLVARIKRLGLRQYRLANILRVSPTLVTFALQGKNDNLLARIERHVALRERRAADRLAAASSTAPTV